MNSWRDDIQAISEMFGNEQRIGWRQAVAYIAEAKGHVATSWREAARMLASDYSVPSQGWRNDIWGIAQALGKQVPEGWRKDLRYIRESVEENPPVPMDILFCLNTLPKQPNTQYRWLDNEYWSDNLVWID